MAGELTEREQWEQQVFTAFAKRSGLNITLASITSCKPDLPDICCDIDHRKYFFELAEVVPAEHARALSTKGIASSGCPDPDDRGTAAMVRIIKQKQGKKYTNGSDPLDLLLYFSKDFPMYLSDVTPDGAEPTEIDRAAQECIHNGPFSRIWTYCSWTDQVTRLA